MNTVEQYYRSLPPSDVKVKLINSLKKIRITDYTVNCCRILIEGEKAEDEMNLDYSSLLNRLKDVTKLERNNIVEKILNVLRIKEAGAGEELSSLLEEINQPMFANICSKEYFVQVLSAVKSLAEPIRKERESLGLGTSLDKSLEMLVFFLIKDGVREAKSTLRTLFMFCLPNISLSEDEKKEVGTLMAENITYIQKSITPTILIYRLELGLNIVKTRSALQFISDNFANTQLSDHMYKIDESIKTLDKLISEWFEMEEELYSDSSDDSDGGTDSDGDDLLYLDDEKQNEIDFITAGGTEVPDHHTWWKEYRRIFFDKII